MAPGKASRSARIDRFPPPAPRPGVFGITADLAVSVPRMERAQAEALVRKAHQVCPYSNATRGIVAVGLTAA